MGLRLKWQRETDRPHSHPERGTGINRRSRKTTLRGYYTGDQPTKPKERGSRSSSSASMRSWKGFGREGVHDGIFCVC